MPSSHRFSKATARWTCGSRFLPNCGVWCGARSGDGSRRKPLVWRVPAALLLDSNSRSSARARGPKTASGIFARGPCNAPLEAEVIGDECWRLGIGHRLATELVNQPERTGVCLAAVLQTLARSPRFACLAGRIAGIADTRGGFVGRLEDVLAPGHASFGPTCARHSDLRTRGLNRVQPARPVSGRQWLSSSPLRRRGDQRLRCSPPSAFRLG